MSCTIKDNQQGRAMWAAWFSPRYEAQNAMK